MRSMPFAFAALALMGCSEFIWFEVQAEAVCHRLPAQRFEIPAEARGRFLESFDDALELSRDFAFDMRAGLSPELGSAASTRLWLTSIDVTAHAPTRDLAFIDEARVVLLPPESSALERRELAYRRETAAPRSIGWRGEPLDLMPWLEASMLRLSLAFVGHVPTEDAVVVDLDVCGEGSLAMTLN